MDELVYDELIRLLDGPGIPVAVMVAGKLRFGAFVPARSDIYRAVETPRPHDVLAVLAATALLAALQ